MPSRAERRHRGTESSTLVVQVLVTGEGGTDGWLYREIPMPPTVVGLYAGQSAELGSRAQQFVELAGTVSGKVLRAALLQFVDGSDDVDWKNRDFERAIESAVAGFETAIDEAFFGQLFDTFEQNIDERGASRRWGRWLMARARESLSGALQTLPTRDPSRLFAATRAERQFNFSMRKHLGALLTEETAKENT